MIILAFSGWSPTEIAATRGRSVVTFRNPLRAAVLKAVYVDVCELGASIARSTWRIESHEQSPRRKREYAIFDYCRL